jgi:hypothetical protein
LAVSAGLAGAVAGQGVRRDGIADMLQRVEFDNAARVAQATPPAGKVAPTPPQVAPPAPPPADKDPREGDPSFDQAARLMRAIDAILQDTARNRGELRKLPSREEFVIPPLWTETREDREKKVRDLLDSAIGIVADVPVVDLQKRIETARRTIRDHDERIVKLREKQLTAPKDGMLPGYVTDTVDSLAKDIEDTKKRIEANRDEIKIAKGEVTSALSKSGIQLAPEQVDLLMDGVLSGDLMRLVAVFNAAKLIDQQLARLMAQSGENVDAARKYFAMHAALFAMLVHSQDSLVTKIDKSYLPKLDAIAKDVAAARAKTAELLRAENRPDQKRVLEANRDNQKLAEDAAKGYRRYLQQQRDQIARARTKAAHDLRIADNTFETVEASYQLRNLMRDSTQSFEAIQRLEAPTFDQIFKNEELRREFDNLTRKLDQPAS